MVKICVFGDSITWGARLAFRDAWANLLRSYLESASDEYVELYDLGIDGNVSSDVVERFDVEAEARNPEVIFFAFGVNDSCYLESDGNRLVDEDNFERNVLMMIGKAKKYSEKIIFVGLCKGEDVLTCPLPQSTTGKCYDKESTGRYNDILKKVCKKEGVVFINIFDKLKDDDFDDGLHPNSNGHVKIFEEVRKKAGEFFNLKYSDKKLCLVNKDDKVIDEKEFYLVNRSDIYRNAAIWIENSNGEVLVSKRSSLKKKEPDRIMSFAKRVECEEDYESAIRNGLNSYLGIKVDELEEIEKVRIKSNVNNFFCQWFGVKMNLDISNLDVDSREISEVMWISKNDLKSKFENSPHLFVDGFGEYLKILR